MIPLSHYLIGLPRLDCLEWAVDVFTWWTCLVVIDSLVGKLTRKGCIRGDTLLYGVILYSIGSLVTITDCRDAMTCKWHAYSLKSLNRVWFCITLDC